MSNEPHAKESNHGAAVGPATPDRAALECSEVFSLLANERRREAVRVLSEVDGAVDFGDLAETVACIEEDTTREALSSDDRQAVYVSLYQTHVPKLRDAGVVDYDEDAGKVAPTDALSQLTRHLDGYDAEPSSWNWLDYHVVGGAISVALWVVNFLSILGGYALVLHLLSVTSTMGVTLAHLSARVRSALPFGPGEA